MSFSENVKQIRREKNISQEEMAEMLQVSRQAVSKWESGQGYPEVETLLLIANQLHISLDQLMAEELLTVQQPSESAITGKISIASYDGMTIVQCTKISSSKLFMFKERADYANYTLFGVESGGFWGENRTLLGLYNTKEDVEKEMRDIMEALKKGKPFYELQYAENIEIKGGKFKRIAKKTLEL